MTTRPDFWDLPYRVRESFLWNLELDYDSYESSMEEKVSQILSDPQGTSDNNRYIIDSSYARLSLAEIEYLLIKCRSSYQTEISRIDIVLQN